MTKVELINDILRLDSTNVECILWTFDKQRLEKIRLRLIKSLNKFHVNKDLVELGFTVDNTSYKVTRLGVVKCYEFDDYILKIFSNNKPDNNIYYLSKIVYDKFLEEDKIVYLYEGNNKQECLEILKKENKI